MKIKFITYLIVMILVSVYFIFAVGLAEPEIENVTGWNYDESPTEYDEYAQIDEGYAPESVEYLEGEEEEVEGEILDFYDKEPEFPGGVLAMDKYISDNIVYPEWEKENDIEGTVYVRFVVDKDGAIKSPKILKSVEGSIYFDDEVIRVIRSMPAWTPGEQAGEKVNVRYTLPVNFRIE